MIPQLKRPTASILVAALVFVSVLGCANVGAESPADQPEATLQSAPLEEPIRTSEPTPEATATPQVTSSGHTAEQIAAAQERAQCLKDNGISTETVRSIAMGEVPEFTPELLDAMEQCGMGPTFSATPRTENPIQLDLTAEQLFCVYEGIGQEAVDEMIAGGTPTVDAFGAFSDCGIDLAAMLPGN